MALQRTRIETVACDLLSRMHGAPHASPQVREVVRVLVACGLDDFEVAVAAYICGQPPSVADLSVFILHALMEQEHDDAELLRYARWVPLFSAMLVKGGFATPLARAACVQYVRREGAAQTRSDVEAESSSLLKMLQTLRVRELRPLMAAFGVNTPSGPRKLDLAAALHADLMGLARAGAARTIEAAANDSEPSAHDVMRSFDLPQFALAAGDGAEAADSDVPVSAASDAAAVARERERLWQAADAAAIAASREMAATFRASVPAHAQEAFDLFVAGASSAGHDVGAAAVVFHRASEGNSFPTLRWEAAARAAGRYMRDRSMDPAAALALAIKDHTLPGTTSSAPRSASASGCFGGGGPPHSGHGGGSPPHFGAGMPSSDGAPTRSHGPPPSPGGGYGPASPSAADVGDVSHVPEPAWYSLRPSQSELTASVADPRAWAVTLASAPSTKGQLKDLHVTQHTLLGRIGYPKADYRSYITARPLLQQDLAERYVHRLAQKYPEERAVTDVARELAAAARMSPLGASLRSLNHLETRGHAGICDLLMQLDAAYLPQDGSFAVLADFEANEWKEGVTLLDFTLQLLEDATALLPSAEHGGRVTSLLGRELFKCRREYDAGGADMPYQLHALLDEFASELSVAYRAKLDQLADDLRSSRIAREWRLVRCKGSVRGHGAHLVDEFLRLTVAERAAFISDGLPPSERDALINALQDSDQGRAPDCTHRGANMDLAALVAVGMLPQESGGQQVANLAPFASEASPLALRAGGRQGPCALCHLHEDVARLVFYANEDEYREKWRTAPYNTAHETSTRPIDNFPMEYICHWPHRCPIAKKHIRAKVDAQPALKVHLTLVISDSDFSAMLSAARPDEFRTNGKGGGRSWRNI